MISPNSSPLPRGIAGVVRWLAFFVVASTTGLLKKSHSSDLQGSLELSLLMADTTAVSFIFILYCRRTNGGFSPVLRRWSNLGNLRRLRNLGPQTPSTRIPRPSVVGPAFCRRL